MHLCDGRGCVCCFQLAFPSHPKYQILYWESEQLLILILVSTPAVHKKHKQPESVEVLSVWNNFNLSVCLLCPACPVSLFTFVFHLATDILCGHKDFSVSICEQV